VVRVTLKVKSPLSAKVAIKVVFEGSEREKDTEFRGRV
jgi:hypothetical protein